MNLWPALRLELGCVAFVLGAMLAGCSGSNATDVGASNDAMPDGGTQGQDAASGPDTGPQLIAFTQGQPASLYWDDTNQTLYIADDDNNQIWTWTDQAGLQKLTTTADPLGAADAGAALVGQIQKLSNGSLVVMRFGKPGGGYGGIAYVDPDGGTNVVPNLDQKRQRLGLGVAPGDHMYGSYFMKAPDGGAGQVGALTTVDLQNGETDYATGFHKIIGVLPMNGTLYVADQPVNTIYALPLNGAVPDGGPYTVFATLPVPDQMCEGPNGTIFTGQFQAAAGSSDPIAVRQIFPDGHVVLFAKDPDVTKPSGVAYDPTHKRLFVADSGNSAKIGVKIFPVP
jgi:sugar lactone lactonase YvrE